jgi:hypothetical protein
VDTAEFRDYFGAADYNAVDSLIDFDQTQYFLYVGINDNIDPVTFYNDLLVEAWNGKTWLTVPYDYWGGGLSWHWNSNWTYGHGISKGGLIVDLPNNFVAGQNYPLQKGNELKFRARLTDNGSPAVYSDYVTLDKTFKDVNQEKTVNNWYLDLYDGSVNTDNISATSGNKAVKVYYDTTTPLRNASWNYDYISSAGTVVTGWDTNIFATAPTVELDPAGHLVVNLSVKFGQTASTQTIELKGVKDSSGNEVRGNVTIHIP